MSGRQSRAPAATLQSTKIPGAHSFHAMTEDNVEKEPALIATASVMRDLRIVPVQDKPRNIKERGSKNARMELGFSSLKLLSSGDCFSALLRMMLSSKGRGSL